MKQGDLHSLLDLAHLERLHAEVRAQPIDVGPLLSAADEALQEERLDDAETLLRGALIAAPTRATAWRGLGRLAEASGQPEVAIAAFNRAVELGDDEIAALELATILASTGAFEEASALAHALGLEASSRWVRARASELVRVIAGREARHAAR